jgi:diaminopimelate decarboxylase
VRDELWSLLPEHSGVGADGVLTVGGVAMTELAEAFGTPLHILDEDGLRAQARRFVGGLRERWPSSEVLFASKSLPIGAMYRLAAEEGLSVDVAGAGELLLALRAGVPPERLYLHGNAKSEAELRLALDAGVGTIIVDNEDELDRLERLLARPQRLLLRVIPGIEAHTYAAVSTGGAQSKFGLPVEQAARAIERMRAHPLMAFEGVHLHIGSQILNTEQFAEAVERISTVGEFPVYNVGGGLGVKYTWGEEAPSVDAYLDDIVAAAKAHLPGGARLLIEPGRSLVARSGVTLYRVLSVKRTGRHFVAVDGGMADQLDIALAPERHVVVLADRMHEAWTATVNVVGRQCESGDLFVADAPLAEPRVGDLLVYAGSGAYAYSTANNYNGALKPAVVFVRDGRSQLVVRRETYEEMLAPHLV